MSDEVKKVKWEDVKNQMVGLIPLTNAKSWEFTPKLYDSIPEEFRPIFKIKMFTMESSEKIRKILADSFTNDKKKKTDNDDDKHIMDEIFNHFVGWKNLYDLGTGEVLAYNGTREMFDLLPKSVVMKIFEEALVLCGIFPRSITE